MSRVYYREPQITGDFTLENQIKITDLQFIIDRNLSRKQPLDSIDIPVAGLWTILKGKGARFRYAFVNSKEQLFQTPDRGYFYAPKSIVLLDKKDYYYPTIYYFVTVIGNCFEVRKCNAGKGAVWTEIADIHTPVDSKKVMHRVENSIQGLKQYFGGL